FGAVLEHHATHSAMAYVNAPDRRCSANLDPEFSPSRSQRLRNRSHASHDVSVKALQFVFSSAEQVEQQTDRRPRLVWSPMFSVNVIRQKHGFDFLRLKLMVEKLPQTAGEERDQLRNLGTRNAAKSFAHTEQVRPTPHRRQVNFRRRLQKKGLQVARQFLQ